MKKEIIENIQFKKQYSTVTRVHVVGPRAGVGFLKTECHRQTVDCCRNCLAYVGPGELSHLVQHCANQNSIPDCTATAGVIYFHIRKCLVAMISILVISCRTKMSMFTRTRCSAIAERSRCRVRYSFRQEDWKWETIFYGHYRYIFNHCDIIGLKIGQMQWKKRKIRAITAFKVIEVGTNWKPIRDFLLVINSNWPPILYRFGVIAAYCSNFGYFAFSSHPLGS